jgi:signal transduction histidine kinase
MQRIDVMSAETRAARAEHEREEEARRRVAEERLRIARELHDIVGHALMSINVLSSVSARLVDRNPEAGRDALRTISGVSNTALREIRSTLSLLRADGRLPEGPGRGIDDLDELIGQSRRSGMPVTLRRSGLDGDIPAIIGFTVYRIVQESLTNVARHAKGVTEVVVTVARSHGHLDVTVTNDGTATDASEGGGVGIEGMRERVTAIGGRLDTVSLTGGGFRVHARLPLKEGSG